jgi:hypothetical protein
VKENPKTRWKMQKGKKLMGWIEENGWEVLNGNKQENEEGE